MSLTQLSEIRLRYHHSRVQKGNLRASDARRIDSTEADAVRHLINATTRQIFGNVALDEALCKCFLSLVMHNLDGDMIALISVDDHPNVPAIPAWEWNHWLYKLYGLEQINARNTLWVHYVAYDIIYTKQFLRPLLQALFAACWYLEYVVIVVPPKVVHVDWLDSHAVFIYPQGEYGARSVQYLVLMLRQHYVKKYKIRRAVEEDNDDLVPLVHAHSERLRQLYGEYYVAELLTRHQDSGRQMIVAEERGYAIAMLCLNEKVNYDALNDNFELIPFYGLRKPDPNDVVELIQVTPEGSMAQMGAADEHTEDTLSTLASSKGVHTSIDSFESELELEVQSEGSEDVFSIVNVSSYHLDVDKERAADGSISNDSLTRRESQYSAMILSFSEYEMHLYTDRPKLKSDSCSDLDNSTARNMRTQHYRPQIPVLYGDGNAFSLELAVAKPGDEDALRLLLEAAFECFPERDYCVLAVPATAPHFSLIEYFVRVPPRAVSTFPHELYVLHRNAIAGQISVRFACSGDLREVERLVHAVPKIGNMMLCFASAVLDEDSRYGAYVFLSQFQIVGTVVIREEGDVEYLQTHYELLQWIDEGRHKPGSHGVIEHAVISPIFQKHSRYFLRELHRLSDYSVLYYRITPSDSASGQRDRTLAGFLGDFIAVRPRLKPEFTHTNLEGCGPKEVVHRVDLPYALYLSTARHCSLPRYEINNRIVVVGSSDAAKAFLEALLCTNSLNYQVTFTNVTLVSPHGLGYQKTPNRVRDMLFVTYGHLSHRHMHQISLRTYVNVVNGVMTGIDRKNKKLMVNDDSYLTYDLLFLFCGEQFQKPALPASKRRDSAGQKYRNEYPSNVFIVNTEVDGANAFSKLRVLMNENKKGNCDVIIHGQCLEAYCCLASLLEYGVAGEKLHFVDPFPLNTKDAHEVSCFNDGEIDTAVLKSIKDSNVAYYKSYNFIDWDYDGESNRVVSVKFESKHQILNLECLALFIYCEKTVSTRTFLAINRAGLVFDGRLVIDPECRTNDPYIYAAGTLTKYSRKYYADHMAPKYFNLHEIGYKLGLQIRSKLLPFRRGGARTAAADEDGRENMLVPRYEKPISKYCNLPGGLHYLSVTKPGKPVPLETALSFDDYGRVFVTGDCKNLEYQGYFRLHLSTYNAVETITCLAKFPIDRVNLTSIWGKHEKLLNNLAARFEQVRVTDLFEYFREPWACAVYHDRYSWLENSLDDLMVALTPIPGDSLIEDIIQRLQRNNWMSLMHEDLDEVEEKFVNSPYYTLVCQKIMDFLQDNYTYLPMYAHPYVVRCVLHGFEKSSFFRLQ